MVSLKQDLSLSNQTGSNLFIWLINIKKTTEFSLKCIYRIFIYSLVLSKPYFIILGVYFCRELKFCVDYCIWY